MKLTSSASEGVCDLHWKARQPTREPWPVEMPEVVAVGYGYSWCGGGGQNTSSWICDSSWNKMNIEWWFWGYYLILKLHPQLFSHKKTDNKQWWSLLKYYNPKPGKKALSYNAVEIFICNKQMHCHLHFEWDAECSSSFKQKNEAEVRKGRHTNRFAHGKNNAVSEKPM